MRTWLDSICLWNLVSPWPIGISRRAEGRHDWLVLVPLGHQYQAFISDIAGFDPRMHDGSVPGIVTTVMAWLASTWGPFPPWADIVLAGMNVAKQFDADS